MITKKQAQKWANALRSGKYSQTQRVLQDSKGYCCLGVACEIFIPKSKRILNNVGQLAGVIPSDQKKVPTWLKDVEYHQLPIYMDDNIYLTELNDTYDFSFDEIADIIELVYVHRALGDPSKF